jgi:2,4-dienoyl-CoA reductase-like NADH-dependent reductase (Old Yellow Enzyme family)
MTTIEGHADPARSVELGTPLRLGSGQVLKNRIAKSAMSERLAEPGANPSLLLIELYRRWAAGGAGLLVTGNVMIDRRAIAERGNVALEDARALDAFRAWARAACGGGSAAWMQINHPGRQVPRLLSRRPVAPSAIALRGAGGLFARPRALEAPEIEELVARFAETAALARAAGFSGVQIHAAHGYLISQFLSPLTNLRTDAWGGDPDRRRRFLIEVVRAVRAAIGSELSLGVKLNSADFQRGGFDSDESIRVVEALDAEGIDLLEISGGTYESAAMFEETVPQHGSSRAREAFFLEHAEKVRGRARTPLMVTGGFRTRAGMLAALQSRATDVVGLARPLAIEPELPAGLLDQSRTAALPVRLATGVRKLDALVQGAFYGAQLRRLAQGLPPAADLSRWRAVYAYVAG